MTDLRAAILAATSTIRTACADIDAIAGTDRELANDGILRVLHLTDTVHDQAGVLNNLVLNEWTDGERECASGVSNATSPTTLSGVVVERRQRPGLVIDDGGSGCSLEGT